MTNVAALKRKPPACRNAVATVAEELGSRRPFPHAGGRHIVQDHQGLGWPEWARGDIIEVDFDATSYRADGLYVVDFFDPAAPAAWQRQQCARRFSMEGARLHIRDRTATGWEWMPVSDERLAMMKFIGRVEAIYRNVTAQRPGLRVGGAVTGMLTQPDGKTQLQLGCDDSVITIGGVRAEGAGQALVQMLGQRVRLTLETEYLQR